MNETLLALVTSYGPLVIFASAFLSCLALPIPTSLMMLTGGAFAAAGELELFWVVVAAFGGAVIGDQTGYALGRYGGTPVVDRLAQSPSRKVIVARARKTVDERGGIGVFLSTWLFAPLGPWVNFVAGAAGLGWMRFTIADVLGEAIWVTLYVGLGMAFATQIDTISSIMGNIVGLLAALAVAYASLRWIRQALRHQKTAE